MRILFFSKRIMQIALLVILLLLLCSILPAQSLTQTVRGTVVDKQVKSPLIGVVVQLLNATPAKGSATDVSGNFKLEEVPVGRQSFKITFLGYKEIILNDVAVSSGKEVVLTIEMEEQVVENKEVVITADKKKPLNDMSTVSARTVSVEETQRYAAAVNDPARAALAYAGVASVTDGNNLISIRGNAPNGLLWRIEGVEVPNPNHFSSPGSAGGGISILSAQLLANSDFITGAFASEYGNASSGVFDLRLRRGNNERHEFTFQAGVLGMDAAAEGPFSSRHRGSYLINYRYSTLGLLGRMGILGEGGVSTFQDLSYNIVLPTEKYGTFTFFGFGGLSSEVEHAKKDSTVWAGDYDRYSSKFFANTGASGLTWSKAMNDRTYFKIAAVGSATAIGFKETYLLNDYSSQEEYYNSYVQSKLTLSAVITNKFNSHHLVRSGVIVNQQGYKLNERYYDTEELVTKELMKASGTAQVVQGFTQWQFRPTERLTLNAGFHLLYLTLNEKFSAEPRAAARWEFLPGQSLSVGYGLHSQVLPLAAYLIKTVSPDGTESLTNKDLDLLKAHHLVFSYDRGIGQHMRAKVEAYHQWLMNVPVGMEPTSTYALSNEIWDGVRDSLVSKGKGRNYGVELTLEKFFSKDSYFLLSASLFNSNYKTLENTWRNSRFNGKYLVTFTGGKEFTMSEKRKGRVLGFNVKFIYAGGYYDSPIDITQSQIEGYTIRDETHAFTEKMPDYFRADIRVSLKRNYAKWTSTVSLDIQNVSSRKNVSNKYYNSETNAVEYDYQAPLIPVLSYRVEF
ncbi:MAG TPA: TonB-dependent receptor [Bacteroidia bacterium]|nr:TonB-dependent receptor [Bacteroidia bacterium]